MEGLREEVDGIVKKTGVVVKIVGIKRIERRNGEENDMGKVRKRGGEAKSNEGKKKLRDRREWITDNLTEKERRIEWLIKKEAEKREGKG